MAARVTVEAHVSESSGAALGAVFGAVAVAAREIAGKIRVAALSDVYGAAGAVNVQGEQQQKLDVFANEVLTARLGALTSVAAIVSEEDDAPVEFQHDGAEFVVIFDPLDGSSNIDVNVNVGTIFSVQRTIGSDVTAAALQPGTQQVAAGYVVYGPSTVMVVAVNGGAGVSAFTLDDEGDFIKSGDQLRMPGQGPYYSVNEANAASWPAAYREYLVMVLSGDLDGKAYSGRYIGSLVADFHRTLLKGGVFLYPPTDKAPQGKLRLLYEANPLAMIAEQAGGAAVNGAVSANGGRILEIRPRGIHQRTPLIVGSRREVEALQRTVAAGEAK
jgi:fructose-1,6-bisphosphatase I